MHAKLRVLLFATFFHGAILAGPVCRTEAIRLESASGSGETLRLSFPSSGATSASAPPALVFQDTEGRPQATARLGMNGVAVYDDGNETNPAVVYEWKQGAGGKWIPTENVLDRSRPSRRFLRESPPLGFFSKDSREMPLFSLSRSAVEGADHFTVKPAFEAKTQVSFTFDGERGGFRVTETPADPKDPERKARVYLVKDNCFEEITDAVSEGTPPKAKALPGDPKGASHRRVSTPQPKK